MARPKQFDPDAAVDAAMHVFWRQGYRATTPNDLVDELGIGKGSLYGTFGSKRELFGRALDRYRETQGDALTRLLDEPGPARERLAIALHAIITANAADPDRRGCLAVNTAAELGGDDADAAMSVSRQFAAARERIEHVIGIGQASGELRSDLSARDLAAQLHTLGVGLQVVAKTEPDPETLRGAVDAALAALAPH